MGVLDRLEDTGRAALQNAINSVAQAVQQQAIDTPVLAELDTAVDLQATALKLSAGLTRVLDSYTIVAADVAAAQTALEAVAAANNETVSADADVGQCVALDTDTIARLRHDGGEFMVALYTALDDQDLASLPRLAEPLASTYDTMQVSLPFPAIVVNGTNTTATAYGAASKLLDRISGLASAVSAARQVASNFAAVEWSTLVEGSATEVASTLFDALEVLMGLPLFRDAGVFVRRQIDNVSASVASVKQAVQTALDDFIATPAGEQTLELKDTTYYRVQNFTAALDAWTEATSSNLIVATAATPPLQLFNGGKALVTVFPKAIELVEEAITAISDVPDISPECVNVTTNQTVNRYQRCRLPDGSSFTLPSADQVCNPNAGAVIVNVSVYGLVTQQNCTHFVQVPQFVDTDSLAPLTKLLNTAGMGVGLQQAWLAAQLVIDVVHGARKLKQLGSDAIALLEPITSISSLDDVVALAKNIEAGTAAAAAAWDESTASTVRVAVAQLGLGWFAPVRKMSEQLRAWAAQTHADAEVGIAAAAALPSFATAVEQLDSTSQRALTTWTDGELSNFRAALAAMSNSLNDPAIKGALSPALTAASASLQGYLSVVGVRNEGSIIGNTMRQLRSALDVLLPILSFARRLLEVANTIAHEPSTLFNEIPVIVAILRDAVTEFIKVTQGRIGSTGVFSIVADVKGFLSALNRTVESFPYEAADQIERGINTLGNMTLSPVRLLEGDVLETAVGAAVEIVEGVNTMADTTEWYDHLPGGSAAVTGVAMVREKASAIHNLLADQRHIMTVRRVKTVLAVAKAVLDFIKNASPSDEGNVLDQLLAGGENLLQHPKLLVDAAATTIVDAVTTVLEDGGDSTSLVILGESNDDIDEFVRDVVAVADDAGINAAGVARAQASAEWLRDAVRSLISSIEVLRDAIADQDTTAIFNAAKDTGIAAGDVYDASDALAAALPMDAPDALHAAVDSLVTSPAFVRARLVANMVAPHMPQAARVMLTAIDVATSVAPRIAEAESLVDEFIGGLEDGNVTKVVDAVEDSVELFREVTQTLLRPVATNVHVLLVGVSEEVQAAVALAAPGHADVVAQVNASVARLQVSVARIPRQCGLLCAHTAAIDDMRAAAKNTSLAVEALPAAAYADSDVKIARRKLTFLRGVLAVLGGLRHADVGAGRVAAGVDTLQDVVHLALAVKDDVFLPFEELLETLPADVRDRVTDMAHGTPSRRLAAALNTLGVPGTAAVADAVAQLGSHLAQDDLVSSATSLGLSLGYNSTEDDINMASTSLLSLNATLNTALVVISNVTNATTSETADLTEISARAVLDSLRATLTAVSAVESLPEEVRATIGETGMSPGAMEWSWYRAASHLMPTGGVGSLKVVKVLDTVSRTAGYVDDGAKLLLSVKDFVEKALASPFASDTVEALSHVAEVGQVLLNRVIAAVADAPVGDLLKSLAELAASRAEQAFADVGGIIPLLNAADALRIQIEVLVDALGSGFDLSVACEFDASALVEACKAFADAFEIAPPSVQLPSFPFVAINALTTTVVRAASWVKHSVLVRKALSLVKQVDKLAHLKDVLASIDLSGDVTDVARALADAVRQVVSDDVTMQLLREGGEAVLGAISRVSESAASTLQQAVSELTNHDFGADVAAVQAVLSAAADATTAASQTVERLVALVPDALNFLNEEVQAAAMLALNEVLVDLASKVQLTVAAIERLPGVAELVEQQQATIEAALAQLFPLTARARATLQRLASQVAQVGITASSAWFVKLKRAVSGVGNVISDIVDLVDLLQSGNIMDMLEDGQLISAVQKVIRGSGQVFKGNSGAVDELAAACTNTSLAVFETHANNSAVYITGTLLHDTVQLLDPTLLDDLASRFRHDTLATFRSALNASEASVEPGSVEEAKLKELKSLASDANYLLMTQPITTLMNQVLWGSQRVQDVINLGFSIKDAVELVIDAGSVSEAADILDAALKRARASIVYPLAWVFVPESEAPGRAATLSSHLVRLAQDALTVDSTLNEGTFGVIRDSTDLASVYFLPLFDKVEAFDSAVSLVLAAHNTSQAAIVAAGDDSEPLVVSNATLAQVAITGADLLNEVSSLRSTLLSVAVTSPEILVAEGPLARLQAALTADFGIHGTDSVVLRLIDAASTVVHIIGMVATFVDQFGGSVSEEINTIVTEYIPAVRSLIEDALAYVERPSSNAAFIIAQFELNKLVVNLDSASETPAVTLAAAKLANSTRALLELVQPVVRMSWLPDHRVTAIQDAVKAAVDDSEALGIILDDIHPLGNATEPVNEQVAAALCSISDAGSSVRLERTLRTASGIMDNVQLVADVANDIVQVVESDEGVLGLITGDGFNAVWDTIKTWAEAQAVKANTDLARLGDGFVDHAESTLARLAEAARYAAELDETPAGGLLGVESASSSNSSSARRLRRLHERHAKSFADPWGAAKEQRETCGLPRHIEDHHIVMARLWEQERAILDQHGPWATEEQRRQLSFAPDPLTNYTTEPQYYEPPLYYNVPECGLTVCDDPEVVKAYVDNIDHHATTDPVTLNVKYVRMHDAAVPTTADLKPYFPDDVADGAWGVKVVVEGEASAVVANGDGVTIFQDGDDNCGAQTYKDASRTTCAPECNRPWFAHDGGRCDQDVAAIPRASAALVADTARFKAAFCAIVLASDDDAVASWRLSDDEDAGLAERMVKYRFTALRRNLESLGFGSYCDGVAAPTADTTALGDAMRWMTLLAGGTTSGAGIRILRHYRQKLALSYCSAADGGGACRVECNVKMYNWDHGNCCNLPGRGYCLDPASPNLSLMSYFDLMDSAHTELSDVAKLNIVVTRAAWSNSHLLGKSAFVWGGSFTRSYAQAINLYTAPLGYNEFPPYEDEDPIRATTVVHEIMHSLGLVRQPRKLYIVCVVA